MGPYPSRVAVLPRVSASQRSASEVGIFTPFGLVSTRGITVFVPGVLASQMYERIYDPGMGPDLSPMALVHEHQPINNQSVESGFSHRSEGYRPGGPLFSSQVRQSCRCVEGFMIRR